MRSKSIFLRLQVTLFVVLAVLMGAAASLVPYREQKDLRQTLDETFRTQQEIRRSVEQLQTSFSVYQNTLTRWIESGSSLWAELVPQSQAVVERQLDRLELLTQNEGAGSLLSTVALMRGQFDDYFSRAREHLTVGFTNNDAELLKTREVLFAGSTDLLGRLTSFEQTAMNSFQEMIDLISDVSVKRIRQTHWGLGMCAGLMVVWGGLILTQVIRKDRRAENKSEIRMSSPQSGIPLAGKSETKGENQEISNGENKKEAVIDLVLPCHMQTYDFEKAAMEVFAVNEEENTEKTRLMEGEATTRAEDEVLKEVDEILAREIPGVDLGTSPAANDYPDVIIALHQEDFVKQPQSHLTEAAQLYAQTSRPDVKVAKGQGEDVITVDFDQERNDLSLKFKRRVRK